ncbi:MAG: biopolymer transporter ExbD [Opitutales bacterium]
MIIRRDESSEESGINISPLLDVMFILIIFFLATATFKEEEETDLEVKLPESAVAPVALSARPKTIIINVHEDGTYLVNNPVSHRGEKMDMGTLRQELADALEANPGQKVLVRGDRKAYHEAVAQAMARCKEVGYNDASIGYQYKLPAAN